MTTYTEDLDTVSLADETVITTSTPFNLHTATAPQPSGQWKWDTAENRMYRTLDGTAGYVRADDDDSDGGGSYGGGLRSFEWDGTGPTSSDAVLMQVRNGADGQTGGVILRSSDKALRVTHGSGVYGATVVDMDTLSPGRYWIECLVNMIDTTGSVTVNLYDTDPASGGVSPINTAADTSLSIAGTGVHVRFGGFSNAVGGFTEDELHGALAWGTMASGTFADLYSAPTADAGADQADIEPFSTVTLTGTGTGTWSQTSGTTVTLTGTNPVTFEAPATLDGETLTFDYGGDTCDVTVLPHNEWYMDIDTSLHSFQIMP